MSRGVFKTVLTGSVDQNSYVGEWLCLKIRMHPLITRVIKVTYPWKCPGQLNFNWRTASDGLPWNLNTLKNSCNFCILPVKQYVCTGLRSLGVMEFDCLWYHIVYSIFGEGISYKPLYNRNFLPLTSRNINENPY